MRFTVRRPPTGEVSPYSHRPSGGNVACSVDVGVAPSSSAGFALENRLALTVSGSDMSARGASLRRVRGRNLLDPTMSLVLQTRSEQPPTAAADSPVQPALLSNAHTGLLYSSPYSAGHRTHVKGFNPDRVEAARNIGGGFLDPVLAPVGLTRLQIRDRQFRSSAAVGPTLGVGEPLLEHLQTRDRRKFPEPMRNISVVYRRVSVLVIIGSTLTFLARLLANVRLVEKILACADLRRCSNRNFGWYDFIASDLSSTKQQPRRRS